MIQGHFSDSEGSEAVGFSHGNFHLVVEALDNAAGELYSGPKVIENEGAVRAEHLDHLSHLGDWPRRHRSDVLHLFARSSYGQTGPFELMKYGFNR